MAAVDVKFPGNLAQVDSIADLRALSSTYVVEDAAYLVGGSGLFTFDAGSLLSDDGVSTIRPADRSPLQRGRWLLSGIDAFDGLADKAVDKVSEELAAPDGSTKVGFRQAGAGAVARTAQVKYQETVSVLDYGAVGDGTTDDTAAFNAAIATGKRVYVPIPSVGYLLENVAVRDNMHIYGEKSGMSLAPLLIVKTSGTSIFRNNTGTNVFGCKFENLSCDVAPGVTNASFYSQSTQTFYSAYFTFSEIETYKSLRTSYFGLFIFGIWTRCRDGYLGSGTDMQHNAVEFVAGSYGQTNQQNLNRFIDTLIFGSFGGQAAIVGSYGSKLDFDGCDFEALLTPALTAYNIFQVNFYSTWFEGEFGDSIVNLLVYPGTAAASTGYFDKCNVVLFGTPAVIANVEAPGSVNFTDTNFNLVPVGTRLANDGARVNRNEGNMALSGPGAAALFDGMHHDVIAGGRKLLNGAIDNGISAMTIQNSGGLASVDGFLSRAAITVGTDFVTVATSRTGLGGTVVISGADPSGGAQVRVVKDWQGTTVRDVVAALNGTTKVLTFQAIGNDLQMKVDTGSLSVFTTMLH